MKITLAMPTVRNVRPETTECLMRLVTKSKYDLHIVIAEEGYTTAENRNYICVQALNNGSDYLLMIDDDMTFDVDVLDRLLAHEKDIIGVPFHPRCERADMGKIDEVHFAKLKGKEPKEVTGVGGGILLIKCEALTKIERPWFNYQYYQNGACAQGEDWYFCENAKKAEISTWVDPTIKVGHIGEFIYGLE